MQREHKCTSCTCTLTCLYSSHFQKNYNTTLFFGQTRERYKGPRRLLHFRGNCSCPVTCHHLYNRLQMTCMIVSIKQMRHNKHAPCLFFQTVKHVLRFQYKIPFLFGRLMLELKANGCLPKTREGVRLTNASTSKVNNCQRLALQRTEKHKEWQLM